MLLALWDQSSGRSSPVASPAPTFHRRRSHHTRDLGWSGFHRYRQGARDRPARAGHHVTRDRTRRYTHPETSWTGLRCQPSLFCCPVGRVLDKRIWFPAKDTTRKPLCRPDGSHEPTQSSSECPASSRLDIRIVESSKPGCLPLSGFHERPRSDRHACPCPLPIGSSGIPTLLPSTPPCIRLSAVHGQLPASSN